MRVFWKKQQSIIDKIERYLQHVDTCRDRFLERIEALIYRTGEVDEAFIEAVHQQEALADDTRRDIERQLYEKALIPESRGDVLGLIETVDTIPNTFESLASQMFLQKVIVPEELRDRLMELVRVNVESYNVIRNSVSNFFYNNRDSLENVQYIDTLESESDHIERELIGRIFDTDLDKADKILLREIVVNMGDISDLAEASADRLTLAQLKRKT